MDHRNRRRLFLSILIVLLFVAGPCLMLIQATAEDAEDSRASSRTTCTNRTGGWSISVSDTFTGTCTIQTGHITINSGYDVTFDNLHLTHTGTYYLYVYGKLTIKDSTISGSSNWRGIYAPSGSSFLRIEGSTVSGYTSYGAYAYMTTRVEIGNSSFTGTGSYGLYINSAMYGYVENNTITHSTSRGIYMVSSTNVRVTYNDVSSITGAYAFQLNNYGGEFNNNTGNGGNTATYFMSNGAPQQFYHNTAKGTGTGIYVSNTMLDAYYCDLSQNTGTDARAASSGTLRLYESQLSSTVADQGSLVEVYWKANLSVKWLSDSSPVVDAEVTITDSEFNVDEREFYTDADGMVKEFYIMEYFRDNQAKHDCNPYWFNATKDKDGQDIWNFTQGDIENDQVNNFDIVLDDVAPPLVITSPEDGHITNETSFTLEGRTEPNVTAEWPITVEVKLGGALYMPVVQSTGDFITVVNLPTDAVHTIDVRVYDFVFNEIEDSIQVTRDTKEPALTIETPEDETLTNISSIEVAGTTEAGATLTVNEEPVTVDSGGEYSTMVDLEEGDNIITVRSMDIAQNWQQESIMVELDTKEPMLMISEPSDGFKTNEPNIRVIGTTENKATVKVNNENVLVAGTSFQSFMDLAEGENVITLTSCDIAGNCNTTVLHVFLDTNPPTLDITEPLEDLLTREANVVVKGTTEAGMKVLINGRDADLIGTEFSYDYELREGKNSIKVEAEDDVGNKISITRTVYLDTRPPDIVITSPEDGMTTNSATISVEGTTETGATIKVNDNAVALSGTIFTADVNLKEGENTITIMATDVAGNSMSTSLKVDLDTFVLLEVEDLVEGGDPIETTDETINITGTADEDATVVVNDLIVSTDRKGKWKKEVSLDIGENTIVVEANDPLGNSDVKEYKVVRKEKSAPPPPGPIGGGDSPLGNLLLPLLFVIILVVIVIVAVVMSKRKKAALEEEEKKEEVQPTVDQAYVQPVMTPTTGQYPPPQSYGNGAMQPGYGQADQQTYGYGEVESQQMYEQGGYYQGGYVQQEQVIAEPSMAYGHPITEEAQDILDRATRAIEAAEERGEDVSRMKRHMKIANAFATKGNSEKTIHYSQKALDAYQK